MSRDIVDTLRGGVRWSWRRSWCRRWWSTAAAFVRWQAGSWGLEDMVVRVCSSASPPRAKRAWSPAPNGRIGHQHGSPKRSKTRSSRSESSSPSSVSTLGPTRSTRTSRTPTAGALRAQSRASGGSSPETGSSLPSPANGPRAPTSASKPRSRMSAGRWTSPTSALKNGRSVDVLNVIDDHSRLCLTSRAVPVTTAADVVAAFYEIAQHYGFPASVLTDNGAIFTASHHGDRGALATELAQPRHRVQTLPAVSPPDLRESRALPPDGEEIPRRQPEPHARSRSSKPSSTSSRPTTTTCAPTEPTAE